MNMPLSAGKTTLGIKEKLMEVEFTLACSAFAEALGSPKKS